MKPKKAKKRLISATYMAIMENLLFINIQTMMTVH
jgi:hypothetical protein